MRQMNGRQRSVTQPVGRWHNKWQVYDQTVMLRICIPHKYKHTGWLLFLT